MGAYSYCEHCGMGMAEPTPREVIAGERNCGFCDKPNEIGEWDRRLVLEELLEQLEAVEAKVRSLEFSLDRHIGGRE